MLLQNMKILLKNFKKPLDKQEVLCYNKDNKEREVNKNEKRSYLHEHRNGRSLYDARIRNG